MSQGWGRQKLLRWRLCRLISTLSSSVALSSFALEILDVPDYAPSAATAWKSIFHREILRKGMLLKSSSKVVRMWSCRRASFDSNCTQEVSSRLDWNLGQWPLSSRTSRISHRSTYEHSWLNLLVQPALIQPCACRSWRGDHCTWPQWPGQLLQSGRPSLWPGLPKRTPSSCCWCLTSPSLTVATM